MVTPQRLPSVGQQVKLRTHLPFKSSVVEISAGQAGMPGGLTPGLLGKVTAVGPKSVEVEFVKQGGMVMTRNSITQVSDWRTKVRVEAAHFSNFFASAGGLADLQQRLNQ